mmetsp:Transcript_58302/g.168858  ORF Transcript_58302/g.168858 Transcript_58302/m.168858 type:complete len:205 (-) Transcript_58302:622-1236(-)
MESRCSSSSQMYARHWRSSLPLRCARSLPSCSNCATSKCKASFSFVNASIFSRRAADEACNDLRINASTSARSCSFSFCTSRNFSSCTRISCLYWSATSSLKAAPPLPMPSDTYSCIIRRWMACCRSFTKIRNLLLCHRKASRWRGGRCSASLRNKRSILLWNSSMPTPLAVRRMSEAESTSAPAPASMQTPMTSAARPSICTR